MVEEEEEDEGKGGAVKGPVVVEALALAPQLVLVLARRLGVLLREDVMLERDTKARVLEPG